MARYDRLRYAGDSAGDFAKALESLMLQFMDYQYREDFREKEYERQDEVREQEILLKEKWRSADVELEEDKFQRNQWLNFNLDLKKSVLGMVEDHKDDYTKSILEYETASGSVYEQNPLNITEEMNKILKIETKTALDEAQLDANQGRTLLNTIQTRINDIDQRRKLIESTATYMVYNSKGSRSFNEEALVQNDFIDTMWSPQDFINMVNDFKADTDYLQRVEKQYGVKLFDDDGTLVLPNWFDEYLTRLSSTPDSKIAALNVDLMKVKSGEIKLMSDSYIKDITKVTWDTEGNPENAWMQALDSYVEQAENLEKSYSFLPGFDQAYANGLYAARQYGWNMAESPIAKSYMTNEAAYDTLKKMMYEDGMIKDLKTEPSYEKMAKYIHNKAEITLMQDDPVAMLVGSHVVKSMFTNTKNTNMRYANLVEQALRNADQWVIGNTAGATPKQQEVAWEADYQYALRLGMSDIVTYKTYKKQSDLVSKKWRKKVLKQIQNFNEMVAPMIGGDDADFLSNPFIQIQDNVEGVLESIHDVIQNNPQIKNSFDTSVLIPKKDPDDELDLAAAIASCVAQSGKWLPGPGICDDVGLTSIPDSSSIEGTFQEIRQTYGEAFPTEGDSSALVDFENLLVDEISDLDSFLALQGWLYPEDSIDPEANVVSVLDSIMNSPGGLEGWEEDTIREQLMREEENQQAKRVAKRKADHDELTSFANNPWM